MTLQTIQGQETLQLSDYIPAQEHQQHSLEQVWQDVENHLQPWLQERQQLIQAWHGAIETCTNSHHPEQRVRTLCELLMDYISAGHFEIYEKLLEEAKLFNDGFISLAEPLYELIGHSTEEALKFEKRYCDDKHCSLRKKQLPHELSKLGEALEERFEAEDQLVKFFHQLHQQQ